MSSKTVIYVDGIYFGYKYINFVLLEILQITLV